MVVKDRNKRFICTTFGPDPREEAKRNAREYLGGDTENYVVEPLSMPGDIVHLRLSLQV